jgi:aminopeptidase N
MIQPKIFLVRKTLFSSLLIFTSFIAISQGYNGIDVRSYHLNLHVSDSSDVIHVHEDIYFYRKDPKAWIAFDLVGQTSNTEHEVITGMKVTECKFQGIDVPFIQDREKLTLRLPESQISAIDDATELHLELSFQGIPANGLIIGNNMYGERTFFADNWPNRAHHWFACNDHVSDKAGFDVTVHAPEKYEVVANGVLVKEWIEDAVKVHQFESGIPIPVKVMVVGIADFVMKTFDTINNVPVSGAVYPQNKSKALYDLELSPSILKFYTDLFGFYPFEKLMGVQSTTMFGGMENAGCIFYDEKALNGKRTSETLLAHEIVHQWFGNSATESDWSHLWLSEGFATYFTNVYIERTKGVEAFHKQMKKDRNQVIEFYDSYRHPLVDTIYSNLMDLLNANAYQKGGWVLHMLRRKLGDELFFRGINHYYARNEISIASSADLQKAMEGVSGQKLDDFFKQWVYSAGHPILEVKGTPSGKSYTLTIRQIQAEGPFHFPLRVRFSLNNGETILKTIEVTEKTTQFNFDTIFPVVSVLLDPDCDLLFEVKASNLK